MTQPVCFSILENIARDLSSERVVFPTFLDITFQVRNALGNPNLTIDQLAVLVGAEPLMSAKIIRMANSVALNPSGRVIADVKSAIGRIGVEAVRSVSFAVAMEQLLETKKMAPFEGLSQRLWQHSILTAVLCRTLARRLARINPDEAMFAGLVHDIGVFYLLSHAADFPELVADGLELHTLLMKWHEPIGHALLAALGQPEAVLAAVQMHEAERPVSEIRTLPEVLFVANKLANLRGGWRDPGVCAPVDPVPLDGLFDGAAIDALLAESEDELASLKSALGS